MLKMRRRGIDNKARFGRVITSSKLNADDIHEFTAEVVGLGPVTHVRLNIFRMEASAAYVYLVLRRKRW